MVFGFKKEKLIAVALLVLAVLAAGCNSSEKKQESPISGATVVETQELDIVTTFVITGQNFKFAMDGKDNPELKVKYGTRVKIDFTSTEGFHDWVVDEFNARTQQVSAGDPSASVEFIADKKGTFEYYCSVGSHRELGMKGKLVVE